MPDVFKYDVFLSHSAQDVALVRPLAERLRADGLNVWFAQWQLPPPAAADSPPADGGALPSRRHAEKIEAGLNQSCVLVLCFSARALGPEWPQLEAGTFPFRDPAHPERRFIALRLDDTPLPDALAQSPCLQWQPADAPAELEYAKLLAACRRESAPLTPEQQAAREQLLEKILSLGHTAHVVSVAWSPDGQRALSGAADKTLRVWEIATGRCQCDMAPE